MKVYSPIFKNTLCNKVEDVLIEDLKHFYKNGFGLGEDLVEHLTYNKISLYQCPKSKYLFYLPSSVEGGAEYYKQLENRNKRYYNTESWEFYKAKKIIKKGDKVLEIGSGNLSFLKLINDKASKVVGIELNDFSVLDGISKGFDMYNKSIEDFSKTHCETFDVVCSFQVLEHISYKNLDSFIAHSLKCLKRGGRFIVAVPNNKSIIFNERKLLKNYTKVSNFKLHCTTLALNMPPHHMGLWDENSLKSLVKKYPIIVNTLYKEELADFRISLVRDILISKTAKYFGYKFSRNLIKIFLKDKIIKQHFKGDSVLIEFKKI